MTALRCPRCHREAPELTAFCAGCGAPLLLKDEAPAGPVDAPVELDRRTRAPAASGRAVPALDLPGPAATFPPVQPARRAPAPRAEELAAVEESHWDLGPIAAAAATSRREPVVGEGEATRSAVPGGVMGRAAAAPAKARAVPRATAAPIATAAPASISSTSTTTTTSAFAATSASAPARASSAAELTFTGAEADLDLPDPEVDAVEVHVARAEPWRRIVAWLVDGVPFLGAGGAAAFFLLREAAAARGRPAQGLEDLVLLASAERVIALSVVAAVAVALATYATLAHALAGATLGKRLVGIRVVGPDGGLPSPARSAVRSLLALVSAALLGLGFLLALFTRTGRALHDVLARTWVVKAP